jgi:dTDP-4-dehydrorhamnose reductase
MIESVKQQAREALEQTDDSGATTASVHHDMLPEIRAVAGVQTLTMPPVEVWGGLECTVARIGDAYVDQTVLSGHQHRLQDLDALAALGIHAIRYPVLWERIAPESLKSADWSWTDERLARLRELGLHPIAGLVHHGSGPRHTDLTQPDFATKFAEFAGAVAERYPWLESYTPVNEPMTTARFSGLYGHWYPHAHDYRLFLRILFNEVNGIRLAMRAIRRVNPGAKLVQTEDLGRVSSTPRLAYQAEHENHRRWLGLDLLTGRFGREHPLWRDVAEVVAESELEEMLADPCPPDIMGINHYLSGERFLDERLDRYPGVRPGGNGRDQYVDVQALRVVAQGVAGLENLLEEVWDRYRLPVAVTELHNGSSRDEQLRWLKEAWDGVLRLRSRGVDIRAITAWALLGSYDWDSLLTRRTGHYEPGLFDVRGANPRPTALARLVGDLAQKAEADHPALDAPGWWQREERFAWKPVECCATTLPRRILKSFTGPERPRPLLITGGGGALALALSNVCIVRGLPHLIVPRGVLDVADPASLAAALDRWRPWAVINAAGFTRVDHAETSPDHCRRENVLGAEVISRACAAVGVPLVAFSSHLVFDGDKAAPYLEDDSAAPLGVYGVTKAEAERVLFKTFPDVLLIRAGPFFGPWDGRNVLSQAIRTVASGRTFAAAADVTISPTYLPDLADATLDLLMDRERGIWHLASAGSVIWSDLVREAVDGARLDAKKVLEVPSAELGWKARRPLQSVLHSTRGGLMPRLDKALGCYLDTLRLGTSDISTGSFLSRYGPPG